MYSPIKLAFKFLKYQFYASNGKGHGVHSPFVFTLIKEVLNDQRFFYAYQPIENCRKLLLKNPTVLSLTDFGAGSRTKKSNDRSIKEMANSSLKPKKFGQLLFRLVNYYKPKNVLELGTSFGITTAYLSAGNEQAQIVTMEGSEAVSAVAKKNWQLLGRKNIELRQGNFNEILAPFIATAAALDFVFVDGNHRYKPTIEYFNTLLPNLHEQSILVFDDIHWSKEMEQAWLEIQQHPSVTLTIDLFFIGLVFFRKENKAKQNMVIRF
jgi:predicted O-methyltransferase YrrM